MEVVDFSDDIASDRAREEIATFHFDIGRDREFLPIAATVQKGDLKILNLDSF